MSWQDVDGNLLGTGKISKAAIIGLAGGVWAHSEGYEITPAEQSSFVAAFLDPSPLQAGGIKLGGNKFFTLAANERSIYGKKAADGILMVKTKQAVLIVEYASPVTPQEATKIVEDLADYLIGVGY